MNLINCAQHIEWSSHVIGKSLEAIRSQFAHREMYEIYHSHGGIREAKIEMPLESVTLTCLFDARYICTGVFIFLDQDADIYLYTAHCNSSYAYNHEQKRRLLNDLTIQINDCDEEYNILILPTESV